MNEWNEMYPYGDQIEKLASELWRKENPRMSVFSCGVAMKEAYRRRVLDDSGLLSNALDEARLAIDEYYNGDRAEAEMWLMCAFEANQRRAEYRKGHFPVPKLTERES